MHMIFRLNWYQQLNRDNHERRMVQISAELDWLGVHEFACTPYNAPAWDALRPAWMLTEEEQRTWRAVVPIVCFMYVRMHHVDRVKRQLGGEQQVPEDPVNLDGLLAVSARGEDQHWPTRHQQWYDDWRAWFTAERQVTITPTQYLIMPTQQYFEWWQDACRVRILSPTDALDDPCLDALPDDVPAIASQPRDRLYFPGDVPFMTKKRAIDSEEEAEYDRQEDAAGTSGHGGEADTPRTHDAGGGSVIGKDMPVDAVFFNGVEHDFQASFGASQQFMELSMDFIATISESQFGQVADRYQRARAAAAASKHLSPVRPPPPSTGPDISLPHRMGRGSLAPLWYSINGVRHLHGSIL
ncbi:hypothetical protein PIB30_034768 [Stylosanthes scabra]|uniref:Aminotransferase-like plant mobile domain-containing protein n=1 Tax=Stylosanthes scabra TaxID=79078 RepID=A0ABU6QDE0_9FABA|nr:hypothetical protein [Stylosanthes scabra]